MPRYVTSNRKVASEIPTIIKNFLILYSVDTLTVLTQKKDSNLSVFILYTAILDVSPLITLLDLIVTLAQGGNK